jgi:hypothetical protein
MSGSLSTRVDDLHVHLHRVCFAFSAAVAGAVNVASIFFRSTPALDRRA